MAERTRSKPNAWVIGLIILGCVLMFFFGLRTLHAVRKFNGAPPALRAEEIETDVNTIEDWMTIPFISRAYGVPPDVIMKALNIPMQGNHRKSLKELNEEYYPGADGYVIATVKATILAHQPPLVPSALTAPSAPPTASLPFTPTVQP